MQFEQSRQYHLVQRCLTLLQASDDWMTAAELASRLGIDGLRETQRRVVRDLIKQIRAAGHWVLASLTEGYYLTDNAAVWKDYLEGRQIDAKRVIGEAGRHKRMVCDKSGQGLLFCSAK
jgi:biotin operon repressor